jgi:hypothetical protein
MDLRFAYLCPCPFRVLGSVAHCYIQWTPDFFNWAFNYKRESDEEDDSSDSDMHGPEGEYIEPTATSGFKCSCINIPES